MRRFIMAAALVGGLTACGSGEKSASTTAAVKPEPSAAAVAPRLIAQLVNYDLAVSAGERVMVGLQTDDSRLVSFGTAEFTFTPPGAASLDPMTATWVPVPGQVLRASPASPQLVRPSQGVGVYTARGVPLDRAGEWQLQVRITADGAESTVEVPFGVAARPSVVAVGDDAPRTQSFVTGTTGVPATAIDSRATEAGAVPDPALHSVSVAQALAARQPTMIVISTPVFCTSQFCGPITDSVQALSSRYGDKMSFVHIEVWRDYNKQQINRAAAEWIFPPGATDAHEPWVYVVGRDGKVTQRYDNVVSDAELDDAVEAALAT